MARWRDNELKASVMRAAPISAQFSGELFHLSDPRRIQLVEEFFIYFYNRRINTIRENCRGFRVPNRTASESVGSVLIAVKYCFNVALATRRAKTTFSRKPGYSTLSRIVSSRFSSEPALSLSPGSKFNGVYPPWSPLPELLKIPRRCLCRWRISRVKSPGYLHPCHSGRKASGSFSLSLLQRTEYNPLRRGEQKCSFIRTGGIYVVSTIFSTYCRS